MSDDVEHPEPVTTGDTLTRRQVADACRVSLRTVSRWLERGELEGAAQDADGVWHVPRTAILGRLPTGATPEPGPPADSLSQVGHAPEELEELRAENAELRRRAELAETERRHAETLAAALRDNLDDARRALRILEARAPVTPPETPPAPAPDSSSSTRRRWWQR